MVDYDRIVGPKASDVEAPTADRQPFFSTRNNCRASYKSYRARNSMFGVLTTNVFVGLFAVNGIFMFVALNGFFSMFSINTVFSIASLNCAFCIASLQSTFAVGCVREKFKVCMPWNKPSMDEKMLPDGEAEAEDKDNLNS